MKTRELVITIALCATILVAAHWIAGAHRYDFVAVAAGSGGSQETEGSTEFHAYLVDRKTGRVWFLLGDDRVVELPAWRMPCKQMGEGWVETESGCEKR